MATTSAIGSAVVYAHARGNRRACTVRYVALALLLAAIVAGIAIALWGEPALGITKLGPPAGQDTGLDAPGDRRDRPLLYRQLSADRRHCRNFRRHNRHCIAINGGGFAGLPVEGVPGWSPAPTPRPSCSSQQLPPWSPF